jgi:hypothetical protein
MDSIDLLPLCLQEAQHYLVIKCCPSGFQWKRQNLEFANERLSTGKEKAIKASIFDRIEFENFDLAQHLLIIWR